MFLVRHLNALFETWADWEIEDFYLISKHNPKIVEIGPIFSRHISTLLQLDFRLNDCGQGDQDSHLT